MKERILKLLKKAGTIDKISNDYYKTWKMQSVYTLPLTRDGFCHEWSYYKWAGMIIHHNIETDKIICFCDNKKWEEQ